MPAAPTTPPALSEAASKRVAAYEALSAARLATEKEEGKTPRWRRLHDMALELRDDLRAEGIRVGR